MIRSMFLGNILDALVPISRFNKGEANKIFDEVRLSGLKVVVKNNTPTCVLLAPEKYQEMTEIIEDHYLLTMAEERLKKANAPHAFEEILEKEGLTFSDIDEMEDVEIE